MSIFFSIQVRGNQKDVFNKNDGSVIEQRRRILNEKNCGYLSYGDNGCLPGRL